MNCLNVLTQQNGFGAMIQIFDSRKEISCSAVQLKTLGVGKACVESVPSPHKSQTRSTHWPGDMLHQFLNRGSSSHSSGWQQWLPLTAGFCSQWVPLATPQAEATTAEQWVLARGPTDWLKWSSEWWTCWCIVPWMQPMQCDPADTPLEPCGIQDTGHSDLQCPQCSTMMLTAAPMQLTLQAQLPFHEQCVNKCNSFESKAAA